MKSKSGIVILAILTLSICLLTSQSTLVHSQTSSQSASDDWSMYRHSPDRTAYTTSSAPNGTLLWRFFTGSSPNTLSLANRLRASPTVVDGVVYMGTNNTSFYALNATDGQVIWQVNTPTNVLSSAAVSEGVVYVGMLWDGLHGYMDAYNASTGRLVWRYPTSGGVESSPAVVNGIVYFGSAVGVYALNASNGAFMWFYRTEGFAYSSPGVVDDVVYIGSHDGKVYALDADAGSLIWSFNAANPVYASPAVVDGIVYVNSDNGTLYALNAVDGSIIWQAPFGSGTDHADDSPAVADGAVFVGSRNGYYAFNASDGSQIWVFTSPYSSRQFTGYVYSSPAVAAGVVYFGFCDGFVFGVNASTGQTVWAYPTGIFVFSSPAIVDGVLYVGSYDGYIYALGGSSNLYTPPQATATPTPTPASTSASTPTQTPQPTATSTPTQTPQPTQKPTQTPQPQIPAQNYITEPTENPEAVEATQNLDINLILLAAVVIISVSALITFAIIFTKKD